MPPCSPGSPSMDSIEVASKEITLMSMNKDSVSTSVETLSMSDLYN